MPKPVSSRRRGRWDASGVLFQRRYQGDVLGRFCVGRGSFVDGGRAGMGSPLGHWSFCGTLEENDRGCFSLYGLFVCERPLPAPVVSGLL